MVVNYIIIHRFKDIGTLKYDTVKVTFKGHPRSKVILPNGSNLMLLTTFSIFETF